MGNKCLGMMSVLFLALLSSGTTICDAECKKERGIGMKACKPVAYGRFPSPKCCETTRNTHPECVCPYITPHVAAQIHVERAIKLAEACGKNIFRPFHCGSLVIPNKRSSLDWLRTFILQQKMVPKSLRDNVLCSFMISVFLICN
ncbi:uncharacterized protein [Coffea arabica]|uniref:Bifunctional inhibitor/plant lipid transfer protein/seed storage helical domain-containing protein n=1 Tax=Coffea arabica TaxID=13443 RepID=A0A6P6U131_COFAR|nr:uncharacterized protein LOC113706168 [Coffea arabica]